MYTTRVYIGPTGFLPDTAAKTALKSHLERGPRVSRAWSRVSCRHGSGAIASSGLLPACARESGSGKGIREGALPRLRLDWLTRIGNDVRLAGG
jgi:hypothetical protein